MIETKEKLAYKAFGFTILSDIHFPELLQIPNPKDLVDIEIRIENNRISDKLILNKNGIMIGEKSVLFQIAETAVFNIKDGNEIIVSPLEGADIDRIRLYILGTCMGAILTQRRILALHGSAVVVNGRAYAIVGNRGAGKSTLGSAFISKGYHLLSDDIIAVNLNEEQVPIVTPSFPQQKLWKDSLERLGMGKGDFHPLFQREEKFSVPIQDHFYNNTIPLTGIFELIKTNKDKAEVRSIQNLNRLNILMQHTFRRSLLNNIDVLDWHFKQTVMIAEKVNMYKIERPLEDFTAFYLVDLILDIIKEGKT